MRTRVTTWTGRALGLGLSVLSNMGLAQGLPALDENIAAQFDAIGRLGFNAFATAQGCSATLIAPNLIVTAAHCASRRGTSARRFYAGWANGAFIDETGTAVELRHPAYALNNDHSPRNDIALIVLDRAIEGAAPIPLSPRSFDIYQTSQVAVVGYHHNSPDALSGSLTCPADIMRGGLMLIRCQVIGGNSGSPVLAQTEDGGWEIIAIISSQIGDDAIAVPIPQWLRDEVAEYRVD